MTVAAHLNIRLEDYDARIRTFIPGYEQMLDTAAGALRALEVTAPVVVDVGTGTGRLALRALAFVPDAQIVAVDEDAEILNLAQQRLATESAAATFVQGSFLDLSWPPCDAVVASLSLHHVRTLERKQQLYRDIRAAIRGAGLFITADCCPSSDPRLMAIEFDAWRAHLRASYTEEETDGFFAAWAKEDVYVPLEQELDLMNAAGFRPEIIWRLAPMVVVAARATP